jgi:elongation factor Ts
MNTDLIKQLRDITSAGMSACKEALLACGDDLQRAIDHIKAKGLQNASNRSGRITAEGVVKLAMSDNRRTAVLVEINSETDFTSRSPEFNEFAQAVANSAMMHFAQGSGSPIAPFELSTVLEDWRHKLIATTKENVVVRRWWVQDVFGDNRTIASYLHNNNKLGVLVSLEAPTEVLKTDEFKELAENIAMQICATNPMAVSRDQLPIEEIHRQRAIFEEQVKDKPEKSREKIIEGKFNKWYSTETLLEQEAVMKPKTTITQMMDELSKQLTGEAGKIVVMSFLRGQVGEGLVVEEKEDLAEAVAKTIEGV